MISEITSLSAYLDHLQSKGQYCFLRTGVMKDLGLAAVAFKKMANRLQNKGKLKRVRGDFYMIVPPEYLAVGSLPATWFVDDLMNYLNSTYYVGILSAAAIHGAAHQQPMVFQVVTNKVIRPITIGQVHITFVYKKVIHSYYCQTVKTASGHLRVSSPELTAFDLVRYIDSAGQANHVATVLCELVEKLRPKLLAQLVKNSDVEMTVAQRLGYFLDVLELPIDLVPLEAALKVRKIYRVPLILGGSERIITHNDRWRIAVNETLEPDEL